MGAEKTSARSKTPAEAAPEPGEGPRKDKDGAPFSVPTQLIIIALVAVLVVPGIAFAGLLLARYAHSERVRYELESVDVARAASTALDRYLNGLQTTLQTLSTSAFLAAGVLEGFHQQAERIKGFIGADIGLRRPDGQQLLNTCLPWGAALHRHRSPSMPRSSRPENRSFQTCSQALSLTSRWSRSSCR
jgi:hypothetical protein